MTTVRKNLLSVIRRIGISLVAIAFLLSVMSFLFQPKDNSSNSGMPYYVQKAYLSEPKNTIDIFMIGDSSGYTDYSPMEVWKRTGFTSFTACEPLERVSTAVNIYDGIISCQKPKLIIIDTNMLFDSKNSFLLSLYDHLWKLFPILRYHRSWKNFNVTKIFSAPLYTNHEPLKGQSTGRHAEKYRKEKVKESKKQSDKISIFARASFNELIKKCKDHDIEVLLVDMPNITKWNEERHDCVANLAIEEGLPFIDFNYLDKEIGLDWDTDTLDKGIHMNYSGAQKITAYLASYLQRKYHDLLIDHRNDAVYAREWDADYEKYLEVTGLGG